MSTAAPSVATQTATKNPFPGLRPFEPEESELFFGREDDIHDLLTRLRRTRFLAVVGSSGCGKSSVVRAGLVASLQDGFMADSGAPWRIAIMRPGSNPTAQLAIALNDPDALGTTETEGDECVAMTQATLHRGSRGLLEEVADACLPPKTKVLVLVDQFEELFRFAQKASEALGGAAKGGPAMAADAAGPDAAKLSGLDAADEARAFVKLLLTAASDAEAQVYVVLTMRSEFLGEFARFPGLPDAVNEGLYLLPQMSREQFREVISGPVEEFGGSISNRLVNRLLNDLGDGADQLPVLQHTLMRLWALRQSAGGEVRLDLDHYEKIGQLQGSISKHAEEVFQELSDEQKPVAEKLFRLITDTTPDNQKVRRPLSLSRVCVLAKVSVAQLLPVIDKFREESRSFLMPPADTELQSETVIDISHESLIRQWARLREWADMEARETRVYRRLVENAKAWEEYNRNKGSLYTGSRLVEAEEWAKANPERLDPAEQDFLRASRRAANLRRNWTFIALGVVFCVVFALGAWASYQGYIAKKQSENAVFLKLIAEEQRTLAESRAGEASAALEKLDAQQKLLRQVFSNLFTAFGGAVSPDGQKDFDGLMTEVLAANEALQQIPSTDSDIERRRGTKIRIFIKNKTDEKLVDTSIVEGALEEKGFPALDFVTSSQRVVPINSVWADFREVNVDDVKAVAYTLIRAGFRIKYIGCYPDGRRLPRQMPTIRVGGDPDLKNSPLTVEQIKSGETFQPCKQ